MAAEFVCAERSRKRCRASKAIDEAVKERVADRAKSFSDGRTTAWMTLGRYSDLKSEPAVQLPLDASPVVSNAASASRCVNGLASNASSACRKRGSRAHGNSASSDAAAAAVIAHRFRRAGSN